MTHIAVKLKKFLLNQFFRKYLIWVSCRVEYFYENRNSISVYLLIIFLLARLNRLNGENILPTSLELLWMKIRQFLCILILLRISKSQNVTMVADSILCWCFDDVTPLFSLYIYRKSYNYGICFRMSSLWRNWMCVYVTIMNIVYA